MRIFNSNRGIIFLSLIFFVVYNYLNFSVPGLVNSPDETANLVFIKQFTKTNQLIFPHPFNYGAQAEFIHPRSTFADFGNYILPVGFWGLIIFYGLIAKIIGTGAVVYLTSFLTIAAAGALYTLWKKIFGGTVARYSSLLFLFHPIVWYYTARSLLPSIPFIDLVIIGAAFLIVQPFRKYALNDFLGILSLGVAFLIRPNEIVWVLPAALVIIVAYRGSITRQRWAIWLGGGLVVALAYVFINAHFYHTAAGGYVISRSLPVNHWYNFFIPFGWHPYQIIRAVYYYFFRLFWWFVLPASIGVIYWLRNYGAGERSKPQQIYVTVGFITTFILFVYYGSLVDPSFSLHTITVAYTRYWSPVFIFLIPFIFYFFEKAVPVGPTLNIRKMLPNPRKIIEVLAIVFFLFMSCRTVWSGPDGLLATRTHLAYAATVQTQVLAITPANAIIVTEREDKFFWPKRQVMVQILNPRIGEATAKFAQAGWPVYYFTPKLSVNELTSISTHWSEFGLKMVEVKVFDEHVLYQFRVSLP